MRYFCRILLCVGCLMSGCMSIHGHNLLMGGHTEHNQKILCPVSKEPVTITETTPSVVYKNRMYYFKNEAMKSIFLKEPAKYIDKSPSNQESSQIGTYLLLGLGALVMWAMMSVLKS